MIRGIIILMAVAGFAWSAAAQEATQGGPGKTQDRVQPDKKVIANITASGPAKSACEKPCQSWSSWQPDPAFSFEACVAKCVPDPAVSDSVLQRSQHLQDELQRRANELRKQREAR